MSIIRGRGVLFGTSANDSIYGGVGDDVLSGLRGDDRIFGGRGNDTLNGDEGNDVLTGGIGDDFLNGGVGTDTAVYAGGGPLIYSVSYDGRSRTFTVRDNGSGFGEGVDTLTSIEKIRFGYGPAANLIGGGTGNDVLNALAGPNYIFGDAGNDTLNGGAEMDLLFGGADGDILNGNASDDFLDGGDGNDRLDGGAGRDFMVGGRGNDYYIVDDIGDFVSELFDEGVDTIQTSVTLAVDLAANVEDLVLSGNAALDGRGNALDNRITGNGAANVLYGGGGNDALIGGAGTDTALYSGGSSFSYDISYNGVTKIYTVTDNYSGFNEGVDTLSGIEIISFGGMKGNLIGGGTGADRLTGLQNGNVNALFGDAGNDTLIGGGDVLDYMEGGSGNDTFVVDSPWDVVEELANGGVDTVQTAVTLWNDLANNVENLTLTGSGVINGRGNTLNNVITGNSGANILFGGGGNDTLNGGGGVDTALYASGDPLDYWVNYNAANRSFTVGGAGSGYDEGVDTLSSIEKIDFGGDLVANLIGGSTGADTLNALSGPNYIFGDAGNDTINGGSDIDIIFGGRGQDRLTGNAGNDAIDGGEDNDIISGGAGYDWLTGGSGNDVLDAGIEGAWLIGGTGTDTLIGGTGVDQVVFLTLNEIANDSVSGFAANDLIMFGSFAEAFDANTVLAGNQAFDYIEVNAFSAAGQLRFQNGVIFGNMDGNLATSEFQIRISLIGQTQLGSDNFWTVTDVNNPFPPPLPT